jgi:hypothetical protein
LDSIKTAINPIVATARNPRTSAVTLDPRAVDTTTIATTTTISKMADSSGREARWEASILPISANPRSGPLVLDDRVMEEKGGHLPWVSGIRETNHTLCRAVNNSGVVLCNVNWPNERRHS